MSSHSCSCHITPNDVCWRTPGGTSDRRGLCCCFSHTGGVHLGQCFHWRRWRYIVFMPSLSPLRSTDMGCRRIYTRNCVQPDPKGSHVRSVCLLLSVSIFKTSYKLLYLTVPILVGLYFMHRLMTSETHCVHCSGGVYRLNADDSWTPLLDWANDTTWDYWGVGELDLILYIILPGLCL